MTRARRLLCLAGASVLVASSVALAATSAPFSGKTGQKAKITFRVSSGTVSKLKTSVSVICIGAYPVIKNEFQVVPIGPKGSVKIRGGRFTFTIPAPVAHPGKNEKTTVTGTIKGKSASGSIKSLFGKTWLVTDPRTLSPTIEVGSCAAKTTWSARS